MWCNSRCHKKRHGMQVNLLSEDKICLCFSHKEVLNKWWHIHLYLWILHPQICGSAFWEYLKFQNLCFVSTLPHLLSLKIFGEGLCWSTKQTLSTSISCPNCFESFTAFQSISEIWLSLMNTTIHHQLPHKKQLTNKKHQNTTPKKPSPPNKTPTLTHTPSLSNQIIHKILLHSVRSQQIAVLLLLMPYLPKSPIAFSAFYSWAQPSFSASTVEHSLLSPALLKC